MGPSLSHRRLLRDLKGGEAPERNVPGFAPSLPCCVTVGSLLSFFFCETGMPVPVLPAGVGWRVALGWEGWGWNVWVCVWGVGVVGGVGASVHLVTCPCLLLPQPLCLAFTLRHSCPLRLRGCGCWALCRPVHPEGQWQQRGERGCTGSPRALPGIPEPPRRGPGESASSQGDGDRGSPAQWGGGAEGHLPSLWRGLKAPQRLGWGGAAYLAGLSWAWALARSVSLDRSWAVILHGLDCHNCDMGVIRPFFLTA